MKYPEVLFINITEASQEQVDAVVLKLKEDSINFLPPIPINSLDELKEYAVVQKSFNPEEPYYAILVVDFTKTKDLLHDMGIVWYYSEESKSGHAKSMLICGVSDHDVELMNNSIEMTVEEFLTKD